MHHTRWSMPRGRYCERFEVTYLVIISVFKKAIELRTIPTEFSSLIKYFAKDLLYFQDLLTNSYLTSKPILNIWRSTEVICMNMSFNNPLKFKIVRSYVLNYTICLGKTNPARRMVEIHYTIDNSAGFSIWITHYVRYSIGCLIEE